MMATSVPSPIFSATGFVAPSGQAVFGGRKADINAAFGNNLNYNLNTPQGQLASSEAAIISNNYALFVFFTQMLDPAYAFGRYQDAIGRYYFIERDPSEPTALQVSCTGNGAPIPLGALINDSAGNIYACTQAGTIPLNGSITLSFACTVPGPVPVPASTGVAIYQNIPSWDSASVVSGVQGKDVENRTQFEQRRSDSVAGNSAGSVGAIIGAVAKVPGVLDYYGYNNASANPVTISGVVVPANSFYICVAGGADLDVAQAILSKKGPGAPMVGNTTVTAFDNNPLYVAPQPYQITFQIPTALQILFKVTI